MNRWQRYASLKYCSPTPKLIVFGVGLLFISGLLKIIEMAVSQLIVIMEWKGIADYTTAISILIEMAIIIFGIAILEYATRSDKRQIKYIVRKRLCAFHMGNPLHLTDGEIEPRVKVFRTKRGFKITVECQSAKFDNVASLETTISDSLRKRFGNFAVVSKEEDVAGRYVDYFIEDVVANYNKQSVYYSIDDVPSHATKVFIRDDVYIDYSKILNASAIIAGKTRSGKTTAIISTFLLPILKQGRDDFGSRIVIVDPKSAELSLCPHVLSPKEDGSVEHILDAIRDFNRLRVDRQKIINDACRKSGKAERWNTLSMKPCILFLDEYISLADMMPRKASKEKPDYSLTEFQSLLRQITFQGASAGCFILFSVAQASVGTGALESAINNACGIRILFKPSIDEARYLWSSDKLEVLRAREYMTGDAWVSIDGNDVFFVKFPQLKFGEYEALKELLTLYYEG